MRRRSVVVSVATVIVAGVVAFAMAQGAQASTEPRTDAQLVAPAVSDGEFAFYTVEQVDTVWAAVVANYPLALPDGYAFPEKAPGIFHPTDVDNPLFQAGLPDMIAAQYWRCSWLDARINQPGRESVSAEVLSEALDAYSSLPSVAVNDQTGLTADTLVSFAREHNLSDTSNALFALDCQWYEK